ncbi:dimethylarginine dimethylaminohydrolase family protein [Pseudolysobacter antarcticus]|uniref:dimethylarginine dimethylaminohydrolase family protein n=1 Tax=Pseudolysobacter antarcticus TaxID=2511995 RepID=UPI001F5C257C|nr:dimethylargininase [Pseudolysobacter antarcticus]
MSAQATCIAITREVSTALAHCELSFVSRAPIDLILAIAQHRAYLCALESLGCVVISMPAQDDLADSVFVEDVAVVLDEIAIMTRPGAASRRAEVASVAKVLARYRTVLEIVAPGTLDGGDVLRLGCDIYVGESARSNAAGIAQLRELCAPFGYRVHGVITQDCLHLKSAVTQVADDTLLINPAWLDQTRGDIVLFAGWKMIDVDPAEQHAANALLVGDGLIYPACFPHTRQRLQDAGIAVTSVDVSELQKAEGAVTCCSIVFAGTTSLATGNIK